jgi:hypothetical protein
MLERPPLDKSMTSTITSLVSVPHLCLSALAVVLENLWGVALMAMGLGKLDPRPRPHSEGVHTCPECRWASPGMRPGQGTWASQGMWTSQGRQIESVQEGKSLHQMAEQAREIREHLKQAQVELARVESDRVQPARECLRRSHSHILGRSHTIHHSTHRANDVVRLGRICDRLHEGGKISPFHKRAKSA